MRRFRVNGCLVLALLLSSLVTVAGPANAASGRAVPAHVSVGATPATAKVGSVVVVAGTVTPHAAGVRLVLQRKFGHSWLAMGHTKTVSGGRYALRLRAPKQPVTWLLRVTREAPSATAASASVHVRVVKTSFTVKASTATNVVTGTALVVSGTVSPKSTGSVWLQQLQGKTWHDVASAKLARPSTFTLSKLMPAGTYKLRVAKPFSTKVAAGNSATMVVSVASSGPRAQPLPPVPPVADGPSVTTTTLSGATVGKPYTTTLSASGGLAPYNWSVPAAALPPGLTLSAGGVLAGFPSAAGSSSLPVTVTDYLGVVAGRTLILTVVPSAAAANTARAWGHGRLLGNGFNANANTPVHVSFLSGVVALAGGSFVGYGLRADGTVWAWGFNSYGKLGNGSTVTATTTPVQVSGLTGVTSIAGGSNTGYALRFDGTVWAWGQNTDGELGDGTTDDSSTPVQVGRLTGVTAIAAGSGTGYALRSDGTVWAWGYNADGELGDGSTNPSATPVQVASLGGVTAISAASAAGYALRSDGTVWAWGRNMFDELGNGTTTSSSTRVQVSALGGVTAISGGGSGCYALRSDGTVWSWGSNGLGQLGNGATTSSPIRVQVSGLAGVTAIAGGERSGYALVGDGSVRAWGDNTYGELGNGSMAADSTTPVTVSLLSGVSAIAGGSESQAGFALVPG